ncbi:hypothetical protein GCM10027088_68330 [Nocardia goodfellowii]
MVTGEPQPGHPPDRHTRHGHLIPDAELCGLREVGLHTSLPDIERIDDKHNGYRHDQQADRGETEPRPAEVFELVAPEYAAAE